MCCSNNEHKIRSKFMFDFGKLARQTDTVCIAYKLLRNGIYVLCNPKGTSKKAGVGSCYTAWSGTHSMTWLSARNLAGG